MFDQIEKLKQQYTDKYVVVDATVPELARFEGHVGQVKTVNMSGRALVEFDCWSNIGWYDIELDFLKVVPKPEPRAETDKPAKRETPAKGATKPAPTPATGEKKLSPLEMARMQGAAKPAGEAAAKPATPAAGGAKKSTADILAAARAGTAATATPANSPAPSADQPAPAAAAKGKMSTADILAAARAKKAADAPSEASAPAPAAALEPAEGAAVVDNAPAAAAPAKPAAAKPSLPKGQRPSVSEILAWCRANDAKS